MTFRWFIYYSATCGGCAAFLGWLIGLGMPSEPRAVQAGLKAVCLGIIVALILTLIDNLWNGTSQLARLVPRLLVAAAVATVGGFIGGTLGFALYNAIGDLGFILGWTLTGLLVGASVGVFDLLDRLQKKESITGARRKVYNGMIGGALGGLLGGLLARLLIGLSTRDDLWTPTAAGFVAVGILIGLMVGLAQVFLKEAWLKVVDGFRAGRELIVSKPEITIGRAEGCDIGLFGDQRVEKLHARIVQQGDRYLVHDLGTPNGTFVNNQRISAPTPLNSGDLIRVGRNVLKFNERAKRT